MGTSLGPKYIPYSYMDPFGKGSLPSPSREWLVPGDCRGSKLGKTKAHVPRT